MKAFVISLEYAWSNNIQAKAIFIFDIYISSVYQCKKRNAAVVEGVVSFLFYEKAHQSHCIIEDGSDDIYIHVSIVLQK